MLLWNPYRKRLKMTPFKSLMEVLADRGLADE